MGPPSVLRLLGGTRSSAPLTSQKISTIIGKRLVFSIYFGFGIRLEGIVMQKHIYFLRTLSVLLLIVNITFVIAAFIRPDDQYLLYMTILAGVLFFSGLIAYSIWLSDYKQEYPEATFSELRFMERTGTNKKTDLAYDITKFFVVWSLLEFLFMVVCSFIMARG